MSSDVFSTSAWNSKSSKWPALTYFSAAAISCWTDAWQAASVLPCLAYKRVIKQSPSATAISIYPMLAPSSRRFYPNAPHQTPFVLLPSLSRKSLERLDIATPLMQNASNILQNDAKYRYIYIYYISSHQKRMELQMQRTPMCKNIKQHRLFPVLMDFRDCSCFDRADLSFLGMARFPGPSLPVSHAKCQQPQSAPRLWIIPTLLRILNERKATVTEMTSGRNSQKLGVEMVSRQSYQATWQNDAQYSCWKDLKQG